jgi:hypothetical protein
LVVRSKRRGGYEDDVEVGREEEGVKGSQFLEEEGKVLRKVEAEE